MRSSYYSWMEQFQLSQAFDLVRELLRISGQMKVTHCRYKGQQREAIIFTFYQKLFHVADFLEDVGQRPGCCLPRVAEFIRLQTKIHAVYALPDNSLFLLDFLAALKSAPDEGVLWVWIYQLLKMASQLQGCGVYLYIVEPCFYLVDRETRELLFFGAPLLCTGAQCYEQASLRSVAHFIAAVVNYCFAYRDFAPQEAEEQRPMQFVLFKSNAAGDLAGRPETASFDFYNVSQNLNYFLRMIAAGGFPVYDLLEHPIFVQRIENQRSILYSRQFAFKEFQTIKNLGYGAFGAVQYAVHIYSQQRVALKYSKRMQIQQKEANFLKSVIHPCVVRFYGEFVYYDFYYIIMQYCEGGSLFDRIKSKSYDNQQAAVWMAQLASSLYYLHGKNIIHRDLKPQNILLSQNQALIADFGISKQVEGDTKTQTGTKYYISPYIYNNQEYDGKTDVFSLGLVFYNLISKGKHPFAFNDAQAANFYMQQGENVLVQEMSKITRYFRELIYSMLRIDAADRFSIADVCLNDYIYPIIQQLGLPGPRQSGGRPSILDLDIVKNNYYIDISSLFALNFGVKDYIVSLFDRNRKALGKFFQPLLVSGTKFILNRLGLYHGKYQLDLVACILEDILASYKVDAPQQRARVQDSSNIISYMSYECAFYVQPVAQPAEFAPVHYVFAYALELREDLVVEQGTAIVVHKIDCHKDRISVKLKNGALLAFQTVDNGKIRIAGTGTLFTDLPVDSTALPFEQLYEHDQLLNLLGEYANISCPDIFKGKYGYSKLQGLWE